MQESRRRLLSLLFSIVLVLVSLYIFGSFVQPALDDVRLKRAELAVVSEYLTAQQEAKETLDALMAKYKDTQSVQGALAMALPSQQGVADTVYQLQALASVNNVQLRSFTVQGLPLPTTDKKSHSLIKRVGTMRMETQLMGAYADVKHFLEALEVNIKLMDIIKLTASGTAGEGQGASLLFDLVIDTYYQE